MEELNAEVDDMAQWKFLTPWLEEASIFELKLDRYLDDPLRRDQAWMHIREGRSMARRQWIRLDEECGRPIDLAVWLARALEIVLLALRVDPRVWRMVQFPITSSIALLHPDQLDPHVKLCCDWGSSFADRIPDSKVLFFPDADDPDELNENGDLSMASYEDAKRQIATLDVNGHLHGYLIPLTISFEDLDYHTRTIEYIEELLANGAVVVGNSKPTARAAYQLKAIHLAIGWHTADLNRPSNRVREFHRLAVWGVPVTSFKGRAEDDTRFLSWLGGDHSVRLKLFIASRESVRGAKAACRRVGARLATLAVDTSLVGKDFETVTQFIIDLRSSCPNLRQLEFIGARIVGPSKVERFAAQLATSQRKHCTDGYCCSWIQSLTFTETFTSAKTTIRIVELIAQCLPRLKSLVISARSISETCLNVILRSLPWLETLDLSIVHLKMLPILLSAYENGSCHIRKLNLHAPRARPNPLFEALTNPDARITHTLIELGIRFVSPPRESFLDTLGVMLDSNQYLECLQLVNCYSDGITWESYDFLKVHNNMPLTNQARAQKRAFLSVERLVPACGALGSDLCATIFSFVGPPPHRFIWIVLVVVLYLCLRLPSRESVFLREFPSEFRIRRSSVWSSSHSSSQLMPVR